MEIAGVLGFVFAATAIGVLVYKRQADVLYGPYIEGRVQPRILGRSLIRRASSLSRSSNASSGTHET
jgi:hypothetical protein